MLNARHSLHATILDMHAATPDQAALTCLDVSAALGCRARHACCWKVPASHDFLQLPWDTFPATPSFRLLEQARQSNLTHCDDCMILRVLQPCSFNLRRPAARIARS